jgi:CelD/BcsL family acetyltransferase involved in cellulose biosynthesis
MQTREIDPLRDPSWFALVEKHPRASVFHTPEWLEALRRTYGYEPIVLTTSSPGRELANGVVFCRVSSWITGHRMVSLPFSDHCDPLVDDPAELSCILTALRARCKDQGLKYVELRPLESELGFSPHLRESGSFCLHRLDLRPSVEYLFRGLHRDCVRRKIRRAEREGLTYLAGRSDLVLKEFYRLVVLTRRRQLLPPQPRAWFRNLIACMGDKLKIHVASKDGQPVAGILTLAYKSTLVYKYGCSDRRFSNLGGAQLLLWKAIQDAKSNGLRGLDLGRSDWSDLGLINFKDRWGATQSTLKYWKYGGVAETEKQRLGAHIARWLVGHMPARLLSATGDLFYRHVG